MAALTALDNSPASRSDAGDVKTVRLQCAGCGAPLKVSSDLDTFACRYCGTTQRVERKGGVVALKLVEVAIQAVQRGTDRTAAELAVRRLSQEISEAEEGRRMAIKAAQEEERLANNRRGVLAAVTFVVLAGVGFSLVNALLDPSNALGNALKLGAFGLAGVAALGVWVRIGAPDQVRKVTASWDECLVKLHAQLAANRTMLGDPELPKQTSTQEAPLGQMRDRVAETLRNLKTRH